MLPRLLPITLLAALLGACTATPEPPPGPVSLTPAEADSILAVIEQDREDTREWLESSPTSYLAAVSRRDFEDKKTLTVGRRPGNDLRIDDPIVKPDHLKVTVDGDSFHVEAVDPGATFRVDSVDVRKASMPYGRVFIGRYSLRLSHQNYPGLIVFDPESERFAEYKGINYFPPDLNYRYELPLTPNPEPDTVVIMSTRGNQRHALAVGWFDFLVDGTPVRLSAQRLLEPGVGEEDFGIFFKDATCGEESYPLGRYLSVQKLDDGNYVLDFNMVYNPACAYSPHYNCPIPTKDNVLSVAIPAGEQDGHYMDHTDH